MNVWNKIIFVFLAIAVVGALGALCYFLVLRPEAARFTEFYILGQEGKPQDYPQQMEVGEEGKVIVGIVNHEYETMSYWLEVDIDGTENSRVGPLLLIHEDKWEEAVVFVPSKAGDAQKVEFILYSNWENPPYLNLRLWIDVNEKS
jgi:uncharacterized membrane protein